MSKLHSRRGLDVKAAREGIWWSGEADGENDFSDALRIKVASAGPSNQEFKTAMAQITDKCFGGLSAAVALVEKTNEAGQETLPSITATNYVEQERMKNEAIAQHIVIDWETNTGTKDKPEWVKGIETGENQITDFNEENIMAMFTAFDFIPDMILEFAREQANFMYKRTKADSKN